MPLATAADDDFKYYLHSPGHFPAKAGKLLYIGMEEKGNEPLSRRILRCDEGRCATWGALWPLCGNSRNEKSFYLSVVSEKGLIV